MTAAASSRPPTRASYSALLLVVEKSNLMAFVKHCPSGPTRTIPAATHDCVEDPSTKSFQGERVTVDGLFGKVSSTTKSASTWPLIAILGA